MTFASGSRSRNSNAEQIESLHELLSVSLNKKATSHYCGGMRGVQC